MNIDKHHDPYAPEVADMPGPQFRYERWHRAGATDEQLLDLATAHAEWPVEQQTAEGDRIDGVSDYDLAAELAGERRAEQMPDPTDGTVQTVLDQVGDDPVAAQAALEAEQAKDNPRVTLVAKLEAIAATAPPPPDADPAVG